MNIKNIVNELLSTDVLSLCLIDIQFNSALPNLSIEIDRLVSNNRVKFTYADGSHTYEWLDDILTYDLGLVGADISSVKITLPVLGYAPNPADVIIAYVSGTLQIPRETLQVV